MSIRTVDKRQEVYPLAKVYCESRYQQQLPRSRRFFLTAAATDALVLAVCATSESPTRGSAVRVLGALPPRSRSGALSSPAPRTVAATAHLPAVPVGAALVGAKPARALLDAVEPRVRDGAARGALDGHGGQALDGAVAAHGVVGAQAQVGDVDVVGEGVRVGLHDAEVAADSLGAHLDGRGQGCV